MRRLILLIFLLFCTLHSSFSQTQFGLAANGEVIVAIVPMTGAGTYDDPRRPILVPLQRMASEELFDYRVIPSDDGRHAIVIFRAPDKTKLGNVLEARRQGIKIFERGKESRIELEQEVRKYRRNFRIDELVGLPATPTAAGEVKP